MKQGTIVSSTRDQDLATSDHCLMISEYTIEQKRKLNINHQGHLSLQHDLVPQNHPSVN